MSKLSAAAVALMDSMREPDAPPASFSAQDFAARHGITRASADSLLRRDARLTSGLFVRNGKRVRFYWART